MTQNARLAPGTPNTDTWTQHVARRLEDLRFGTILLTIHDGRVVQVDCTERMRFPAPHANTRPLAGAEGSGRES